MYFHLIWIKEKNWKKYDLDILLQWWDEDFIRKFLANRWVVIVSINEYKEDFKNFWNILINLTFDSTDIQIITQWEDLYESIFFIVSSWIKPLNANFIDKPIPESQVLDMVNKALLVVDEEDEKIRKQAELEALNEQKKYEERWIKDWLKILNVNIDHMDQILKAGKWVLAWSEIKELENCSDEMKKIRLWTNFNKMVSLVLEAHNLIRHAEKKIFAANDENKFLIDKNSFATNIDLLDSYFRFNRISEEKKLRPESLSTNESIIATMWIGSVLLKLLGQDISHTFDSYSLYEIVRITLNLIEFIVLLIIIVISLFWLIGPLLWINNLSLYLLPAMWWLWLLVYFLNNLKLRGIMLNVVWFILTVIVYWIGLKLLLGTFAL